MSPQEVYTIFENEYPLKMQVRGRGTYSSLPDIATSVVHHAEALQNVYFTVLPPEIASSYTPEQQRLIETMFQDWEAIIKGVNFSYINFDSRYLLGAELPQTAFSLTQNQIPRLSDVGYEMGQYYRMQNVGDLYMYMVTSSLDFLAATNPSSYMTAHAMMSSFLGSQGLSIVQDMLIESYQRGQKMGFAGIEFARSYSDHDNMAQTIYPGQTLIADYAKVCPAAPRRSIDGHKFAAYLLRETYKAANELRQSGIVYNPQGASSEAYLLFKQKLQTNFNLLMSGNY